MTEGESAETRIVFIIVAAEPFNGGSGPFRRLNLHGGNRKE
jgi:hypothetical protein